MGGDDERTMRAVKKTSGFTYWNYDRNPTDEDPMAKAMQWVELAKIFHDDD